MTGPSSPGVSSGISPRPDRRGKTAAGLVLVLVLVTLVGFLILRPRSGDGQLPPAPSSSSTTPGAAPAGGADGALAAAPPGVTWQSWMAVALPYSPTAGPRSLDGQLAAGFAHTPAGALLASVHAVGRLALARDPGWEQVVSSMAAPGPGRDRWVEARRKVKLTATPPPGSLAQIAGFQFISYNPDDAAIQLVTRSSDSSLSVAAVHMRWIDGDWRLVLVPAGGTSGVRQPITTLNGYIAWGAVQ